MAVQGIIEQMGEEIGGFKCAVLLSGDGNEIHKHIHSSIDAKKTVKTLISIASGLIHATCSACRNMGYGKGELIHVQAEKAIILLRCLNENPNPKIPEANNAHFQLVVLADRQASNFGLALMAMNKAIRELTPLMRQLDPLPPGKIMCTAPLAIPHPPLLDAGTGQDTTTSAAPEDLPAPAAPAGSPAPAAPADPVPASGPVAAPVKKEHLEDVAKSLDEKELGGILDSLLDD